ncbi:MAG: hypothetical protein DKM50_08905 [Candidatus Margulisiibacteriota bacterium]|nr:MAG: hypothetical protein A2X43_04485 [Candidatus Margulisbacteria bacterium GWD2_39_127]OGI04125.1 MAG: hypothetical protein A2X42_04680 [Candidatus Margulisbacteria bacterium GWF2_38_17]OGI05976.1 MAG: hypothetical protein A2X41_12190 [Candidatus Margulisbacteria bacterium GWE2_39_32]PZM79568.1 MAG: hypothetical protein DKM50_08905 [Candidatus Margulisiibacteriota bacterium]HAR63380.1 hypothetical protein [Candidatus Margulisiibacteriota bacterium]
MKRSVMCCAAFLLLITGCREKLTGDTDLPSLNQPIINAVTASKSASISATAPEPVPATIAFPGAEGFGAKTRGAYSGAITPVIYHVTNLNDSGYGSFRNAFNITWPLVVVFDIGGTISLTGEISVMHPYVTIAGQTAPGGGICIKGGALRIKSHDIVIRGLRIRNGRARTGANDPNSDGIAIEALGGHTAPYGQPYNIIVDHCSFTWAADENAASWYAAHHITWQWNIIAEPIWDKNYPNITGYPLLVGDRGKNISLHHNLFAHYKQRGPECNDGTSGEIINNVMYHWTNKGTDFIGSPLESKNSGFYDFQPSYWNLIGNYYKRKGTEGPRQPIIILNYPGWNQEYYVHNDSKIYLSGNVGPARPDSRSGNDWSLVLWYGGGTGGCLKATSPATGVSGIRIDKAENAYTKVLANAGACVPKLDAVDFRIIQDVINSTGSLVTCVSSSDYPYLAAGTTPADSDHDDLPDRFEIARCGSKKALEKNAVAPSGYTWMEEYLNSLIVMLRK